jgi:hypothetical protein
MAIAPENVRKPITLPKTLAAELSQEAERGKLTLSEVIVGYITQAKQDREHWEARIDARVTQLNGQIAAMREAITQLVGLLETVVQQQTPAGAEPAPPLPIATYEQMYGTAEEMGAQLRREQEARDATFPQHDGQPHRSPAKARRWRWSWW